MDDDGTINHQVLCTARAAVTTIGPRDAFLAVAEKQAAGERPLDTSMAMTSCVARRAVAGRAAWHALLVPSNIKSLLCDVGGH